MRNITGSGEPKAIPVFHAGDMVELQLLSTSKGNQKKWYDSKKDIYVKSQFFYQGKYWKEYLVEVISAEIGRQLPDRCVEVLAQRECRIVDAVKTVYGVYSDNFAEGLQYVSFNRILAGRGLCFDEGADIGTRWRFVLQTVEEVCKLDYTDYLITMVLMDYLIGNEDRHLNNFGVLYRDNAFFLPPLFDFGIGLFEHDLKYEHVPFRECSKTVGFKRGAAAER